MLFYFIVKEKADDETSILFAETLNSFTLTGYQCMNITKCCYCLLIWFDLIFSFFQLFPIAIEKCFAKQTKNSVSVIVLML